MNERFIYLALRYSTSFSARGFHKLIAYFGDPQKLFNASLNDLLTIDGINRQKCEQLIADLNNFNIEKTERELHDRNISFSAFCDATYPIGLKEIFDPPLVLFTKGQPLSSRQYALGIVGTRRASAYGKRATEMIVNGMEAIGGTIISGMAKGIDSIAHSTALERSLYTIAVLGTGVDHIYPYENKGLYEKIMASGTIVSELLPGSKPERFTFPLRNRIISGMSRGVAVIEASLKSGAMITAKYAVEQNRDVFAVPGSIFSDNSSGVHFLIKEGAIVLEKPEDIFKQWNISSIEQAAEKIMRIQLTEDEKRIIDVLATSQGLPLTIDDIYARVAQTMSLNSVMSTLMMLAMRKDIDEVQGKQYILLKEVI